MEENILLHNPRCSKSRETKKLLEERDIYFEIREYLKFPLSKLELQDVIRKLGYENATDLIRTKEEKYKDLVRRFGEPSESQALDWLANYPELMERPILITEREARIGRPPENVLEIL